MTDDLPITPVAAQDVAQASQRLAGITAVTPCRESVALSELTGCRVFCKLETLQRTGSFKERGAANALALADATARKNGVVAASAGNHALALAYHGRREGIAVTVVMPTAAPLIKVATCRRFDAKIILHGDSFAEARQHADEIAMAQGLTYIHGYDDHAVIAGQGTLGLEILQQVSDIDAIVVPVGGGGLIAGMAVAVKAQAPAIQIIGVEPTRAASFTAALKAGSPVAIKSQPTLADGLAVGCVGARGFATARDLIDRMVCVHEADIALAVLRLMELEKAVVEGAGAASLAALLSGQLDELKGKTLVLPLCGGNIDPVALHRVIEHGLVADGRLHHIDINISDRPGGLAELTNALARAGASIRDLRHDRAFSGPDMARVAVQAIIETQDTEHYQQVCRKLQNAGFVFTAPFSNAAGEPHDRR